MTAPGKAHLLLDWVFDQFVLPVLELFSKDEDAAEEKAAGEKRRP